MSMRELLYKVDNDKVAEEMTAMLTDPDILTYDMFEDLVIAYTENNSDFRKGIDKALEILIWRNMENLAEYMKKNCLK